MVYHLHKPFPLVHWFVNTLPIGERPVTTFPIGQFEHLLLADAHMNDDKNEAKQYTDGPDDNVRDT